MSYCGTCFVGINIDTGAVPDPDVLMECMRDGFDEILASAGGPDMPVLAERRLLKYSDRLPRRVSGGNASVRRLFTGGTRRRSSLLAEGPSLRLQARGELDARMRFALGESGI